MMLYFNFIIVVVCPQLCVQVTCVYEWQYLTVFCPCAVILLLEIMGGGS